MSARIRPERFVDHHDQLGYGKPFHELTPAEQKARSADRFYADTDQEWMNTDLSGRPGQPITGGPHEAFPGEPRARDRATGADRRALSRG